MVLLDSLDQLDSVDGGRQLDWLPRQLPAHVHLILSTLPDEKYGILDRCKVCKESKQNANREHGRYILFSNLLLVKFVKSQIIY